MKKFLLVSILCVLAFTVNAARIIDGINYELNREEMYATVVELDYPNKYSGDIVIPESVTVGDYEFTVLEVGRHAFENSYITSVSFPESLIVINDDAFSGCKNLKSIILPDNIKAIANEAFSGCRNVTELKLPNNDVMILRDAFSGMYSLTELVIPDKWTTIGLYDEDDDRFYAEDIFAYCSSLRKVVIGKGVKMICDGAFREDD